MTIGCRTDMHDQPRLNPLRRSDFYADQRGSRPLVPGTVPRGQLREDAYFYSGMVGKGQPGATLPVAVTPELLARGKQRFEIYCSPCHSRVGDGNGMIVQRGYRHPPSFHTDMLRNMPIGHFYDVMTNGFGAMPDYAQQVAPPDRWAIAAYIRVLQFSQHATMNDVPAEARQLLASAPSTLTPAPPVTNMGQQPNGPGQAGEQSNPAAPRAVPGEQPVAPTAKPQSKPQAKGGAQP
jgi:mono/diheme cytochrome c family protein